jgi:hypothetical protein
MVMAMTMTMTTAMTTTMTIVVMAGMCRGRLRVHSARISHGHGIARCDGWWLVA